jgi:hypothetical protein
MTNQALVEFAPDPERAGPSTLSVSCFDFIGDPKPIASMVITAAAGREPARQLPVQRLGVNRFAAAVALAPGPNRVAAVARTTDGARVRAVVTINGTR